MTTAVVLGGGGVTGIAWELGLLAGLRDRGIDLSGAECFVGTSAGATVGAQVACGTDLDALVERQHEPAGTSGEIFAELDMDVMIKIFGAWARPVPAADELAVRAQVGALALATETVDEPTRRAVIEHRLLVHDWPATRLLITAVDAVTGEFVVFDRTSGVSLVDAVTASSAVPGIWPCATIEGRRYLDGGIRSTLNADLALGHDRVVVLAPIDDPRPGVISGELDGLRAAGAEVVVISADDESKAALGANPLDPAARGPAADAGHAQAGRVELG